MCFYGRYILVLYCSAGTSGWESFAFIQNNVMGLKKSKSESLNHLLKEICTHRTVQLPLCSHGQFRSISKSYETLFVGNKGHLTNERKTVSPPTDASYVPIYQFTLYPISSLS